MQQPETTLIYWVPSRVRFNLTLILAAVVMLMGLFQVATGENPLGAVCNPAANTESTAPSGGDQTNGTEPATTSSDRNSGWLLLLVGLAVGAYSWLTSPRQYRVYSDRLAIMFGMPRSRTIHFSDIREVVLDRGFMGDPLRVYTTNRRRVPVQVREPEEMHRYLDSAVKDFWRDNPEYAPPPSDEDDDRVSEVVDSVTTDTSESVPESSTDADAQRSPRSRRHGLRDDEQEPDAADSGDAVDGDGSQNSPRSRRRSLRDDAGDADEDAGSTDRPPRFS